MLATFPGFHNRHNSSLPFESQVIRRNKGTEEVRSSHAAAKYYNEEMGGVDLNGSHRSRIFTHLSSKNW